MEREQLQAVFGKTCASGYDQQWSKMAPLREALHLLMAAVLSDLRADARVLCVGTGTGAELIDLAERFPGWRFLAVEPSGPMLDVCRQKAEQRGIAARCEFHEGYLETLSQGKGEGEMFDAATSLLVSQFILDREQRSGFFREIANRLRPGGLLVNADLASDANPTAYESLREVWFRVMQSSNLTPEAIERMRAVYDRDVALLPPEEVGEILSAGGFEKPVQFLQTGLIRAWYTRRV